MAQSFRRAHSRECSWVFDVQTDAAVMGTVGYVFVVFAQAQFLRVTYYCSKSVERDEKEVQKEIAAVMRQITSSVSFLPLLDQPCMCHTRILLSLPVALPALAASKP